MKNIKWTYENCKNEANKYASKSEFAKNSSGAYDAAWRNKWLKDFFNNQKYTYDECMENAKKYKSRSEFSKNDFTHYYFCKKNGWLNLFFGELETKPKKYWNFETCMEESKKYKSRNEFWANASGAHKKACKEGWINLYYWLKTPKLPTELNQKNNYVYVYEDNINKTAYIGRTISIRKRHNQHNRQNPKTKLYDSIKQHFISLNIELPQPKILENELTYEESQIKEDFWINEYIKNGWNVLNKGKTGLNVGSLGRCYIKWTKEKAMTEAKKYKTKMEFKEKSSGAYSASNKHKWMEEFTWLNRKTKYEYITYNECKKIANKYKTRTEFYKNDYKYYDISRVNKWLDDFFPKNK